MKSNKVQYKKYLKAISYKLKANKAFTLAEMIVVLAIVSLIGTVTISRYNGFENTTLLTTLAHDVALSVRQAQVFGVSVRGIDSDFSIGYGIHFDLDTPGTYVLFADTYPGGGDSVYGENDTSIDVYTLNNGYSISDIRQVGSTEEFSELHVVFRRPNPSSEVMLEREGSVGYINRTGNMVEIDINSPGGETRTVRVTPTGQISVIENSD